jgi:hypothetical protein
MPKVLIITRDFAPYCFTSGGIVRMLNLAEYLGENVCRGLRPRGEGEKDQLFWVSGSPLESACLEHLFRISESIRRSSQFPV